MARCVALCILALLYTVSYVTPSRIKIEKNAYKDILIALPREIKEEERGILVKQLEDLLQSSSSLLQLSTKGRSYLSEVTFLVPENWYIPTDGNEEWNLTSFNASNFSEAGAVLSADDADVVLTEDGRYPYVLHQDGCGKPGLRIVLPKNFVLSDGEKGIEFLRLWSEYRYGVFPEGGFQNDEKYPRVYRSLTEGKDKTTGCSFWSPTLCNGGRECEINSSSSLMDQHLGPSSHLFCEGDVSLGPRHNPEPPSKQNLMCHEEGTWFTILRSPDFTRGKNAAPKYLENPRVAFSFVKERTSPRFIVAIDTSANVKQPRFHQVKMAFSYFVYSVLPEGSELTLLTFSGERNVRLAKPPTLIGGEESRIAYIESEPLPEDIHHDETASLDSLFHEIFQSVLKTEDNKTLSSNIIVITTETYLNQARFEELKQNFQDSECRLDVFLFSTDDKFSNDVSQTDDTPLCGLCSLTEGKLVSLGTDALGNLYRSLSETIRGPKKNILVFQEYLQEDDDINLNISFIVDESMKGHLKVFLTFSEPNRNTLDFSKTVLHTPSGKNSIFSKKELLSSWVVFFPRPEAGVYNLITRRFEDSISPILLTVTGESTANSEPIAVKVWAEILFNSKISPPPVKIFTEIKSGMNPVTGAEVLAYVINPNEEKSELILIDDGIGDVDVTKNDGIYGRYFTNFTSSGYYNIYVKASQLNNTAKVIKGPTDLCCGSVFSASDTQLTGLFQREAGPFTLYVPPTKRQPHEDVYPPSRVTDLRLENTYDNIHVIQWTAVGDDYDSGVAEKYELKVFNDRAIIRNRFGDSGHEVYSEEIETTEHAAYGVTLIHAFKLPVHVRGGVYHFAVRAIDDSGNKGEPSNIAVLSVERRSKDLIKCKEVETPRVDRLTGGNAGRGYIPRAMTCSLIPVNIFVPLVSVVFSLMVINNI